MKTIWTWPALFLAGAAPFVATPAAAQLSLNISVNVAPPALPIYDQPPIPGPDYIWAPGYWAWDDYVQDYYWVPGTWVMAPRPGLLWTPPWWGWQDGIFLFHPGYWGAHVGFYGGVPYGFGYTGSGFQGAYWNGGHVFYNRSVTNITNVHVTNVYNKTVIVNRITNVSYNGGPGGVQAKPSAAEQAVMREPHVAPTPMQQQHFQAARADKQLFASANHGRPPVAAAARPGQFGGPGIVPTRQAVTYHPPVAPRGGPYTRPNELGSGARAPVPTTPGNETPRDGRDDGRMPPTAQQGQPVPQKPERYAEPAQDGSVERNAQAGRARDYEDENPAPRRSDPQSMRSYQGQMKPEQPHGLPPAEHSPPPFRPAPQPHPDYHPPHPQPQAPRPHPQNSSRGKPPPHENEHREH